MESSVKAKTMTYRGTWAYYRLLPMLVWIIILGSEIMAQECIERGINYLSREYESSKYYGLEVLRMFKTQKMYNREGDYEKRLQALYKVLCSYKIEKYISFDLGMLSKFNYYTGVMFHAYTYGVGDAIAKGGRYDNLLEGFGKSAPAIGFMINVDDVMRALYSQNIKLEHEDGVVTLSFTDESFRETLAEAQKLRESGKKVILSKK